MIQIYHNPRCGKSRTCLLSLETCKIPIEIINYLEKAPTFDELSQIIQKLGIKPIELVRTNEKIWVENYRSEQFTDNEIITIMTQNPILIQRPIVINGENAKIVRTENAIDEIITNINNRLTNPH